MTRHIRPTYFDIEYATCPRHEDSRHDFFYYPFDDEFPRVLISLTRFKRMGLPFNADDDDPWSSFAAPERWSRRSEQDPYWNSNLTNCTICQDHISARNASTLAVALRCRHFFHASCIVESLKASPIGRDLSYFRFTCPTCRLQISDAYFGGRWIPQSQWLITSERDGDRWDIGDVQFDHRFLILENWEANTNPPSSSS